jgi:hypothetical protein
VGGFRNFKCMVHIVGKSKKILIPNWTMKGTCPCERHDSTVRPNLNRGTMYESGQFHAPAALESRIAFEEHDG